MTDWSLDSIGKRLRGEGLSADERVMAEDDAVRVNWAREQFAGKTLIYDIGASDGSVTDDLYMTVLAIESHPDHAPPRNRWWFCGPAIDGLKSVPNFAAEVVEAAWCGEIIEHLTEQDGKDLLAAIPPYCDTLILTVPNRDAVSYEASGRSRWGWPDHKRFFNQSTLPLWLESCGWRVEKLEPIVGTLDDSIWLGAVCRRS